MFKMGVQLQDTSNIRTVYEYINCICTMHENCIFQHKQIHKYFDVLRFLF